MRTSTRIRDRIGRRQAIQWVVAVLLWSLSGIGLAQQDEVVAQGEWIFRQNCAICHGTNAKGQGPFAQWLTVKPTDLTQLSKKNAGWFPFWYVYRTIDGRSELIKGHNTNEIPVWGREFLIETGTGLGTEAMVRRKIFALVYYLQSIQEQ